MLVHKAKPLGGSSGLKLVGTFTGTYASESITSSLSWRYAHTTISGEFPSTDPDDYIIEITSMGLSSRAYATSLTGSVAPYVSSVTSDSMTINNTGAVAICRPDSATFNNSVNVKYNGNVYYKG